MSAFRSATNALHMRINCLTRLFPSIEPTVALQSATTWRTARLYAVPAASYLPKENVTNRVINTLKNYGRIEPSKINPTAYFVKDLGLDEIDSMELIMAFEEEFIVEIPDKDADKIQSVSQAIDYISANPQAK